MKELDIKLQKLQASVSSVRKREGGAVEKMKKIAEEKTKELLEGFDSLQKRVNNLSNEVYSSLRIRRRSNSKGLNRESSNRSSIILPLSMKINSESFTTKSHETTQKE